MASVKSLYATAAPTYLERGWAPLPIWFPNGTKTLMVGARNDGKSWTGNTDNWPDLFDIRRWAKRYPRCPGIGLRLARDMIGIDIDLYQGAGAFTIAKLQKLWGRLPDTWLSTARSDGSGIRLFRLPPGVDSQRFRDPELFDRATHKKVSGGVEVVRWGHRYCMAWPSVHPKPDVNRPYRWWRGGECYAELEALPWAASVDTYLPDGWCEGLAVREARSYGRAAFDGDAYAWLRERVDGEGEPCEAMRLVVATAVTAVEAAGRLGGAHDACRDGLLRIVGNAVEGCAGAFTAVTELADAWNAAMRLRERRGSGTRTPAEADREFNNELYGAIRRKLADGNPREVDSCSLKINRLKPKVEHHG